MERTFSYDEALFKQMLAKFRDANGGFVTKPQIEEVFRRVLPDLVETLGKHPDLAEDASEFVIEKVDEIAEVLKREGWEVRPA